MKLVLSLFPGIGLLDKAFELEGFCIVRGPDLLWGGDVRRFHPPAGRFDGVIGGPPCQAFSRLAHMVRHNGHEPKFGNLIPEFERVVREAAPRWFVMENVPDAPTPDVAGYGIWSTLLNNRQCFDEDGSPAKQNRVRRWSFGLRGERPTPLMIDTVALENAQFEYAACGGGRGSLQAENHGIGMSDEAMARAAARKRGVPVAIGGSGKPKPALRKEQRLNSAVGFNIKSRSSLARLCELQGVPAGFMEHSPFTVEAACKAVGNGVPIPMGRAIAKAVKEATCEPE